MPTVYGIKKGATDGSSKLNMEGNFVYPSTETKQTYYVLADSLSDTFETIAGAPGIPALGSLLYGAYCTDISPKETETVIHPVTGVLTTLWEVEVSFSTHMRNANDQVTPTVNWEGDLGKEVQEYDLVTGARITTTADEPILVERPIPQPVLVIKRRETYPFDSNTKTMYEGKTNSQPFWNYPVGTAMMMPIQVEESTEEGERICWATYRIAFKIGWNYDGTLMANTWQSRPLNQGYKIRPSAGAKPIMARDQSGSPIRKNLARDGTELKNSSFTNLWVKANAPGSLNPSIGVYDGDLPGVTPVSDDIGSTMVITGGAGFNVGNYLVIGVAALGGITCWILNGAPGTIGSTGGVAELQRCPIFLFFNRAWTIDFNSLSLGPY